jgi:parvulin-like peptidyl-prolyl isomerase
MMKAKPHSNLDKPVRKSTRIFLICYVLFCLLMLNFIGACDKIDIFSRPYVATVNGSKIYLDEYQIQLDKKMSLLPKDVLGQPDHRRRFEEEVLDGMITEKVMYLRAQELNILVNEVELENKIKDIKKDYGEDFTSLFTQENINYEKWKEAFKREMLLQKLIAMDVNSKIKISEDEVKDYFNKHRDHYKKESRVRVAQIIVRDMGTAKKAITRLNSGESFAKVAESVSMGPEAHHGGDMGFITRWTMPEPVDKIIFKIPVNKTSPIVQSSYGFHIFKVLESQPAGVGNFAEVRGDVITDIRMQKEEAAFVSWLEELKKKAVIKKQADIKMKKLNKEN